MPKYYPVFINIEGSWVLVVGGGEVALRKIETLLDHGAYVNVVSRRLHPDLASMLAEGKIRLVGKEFTPSHLDGMRLVIAATDEIETNRTVSAEARRRNVPVNAVDQPSDCTFIVPAVLRRGPLTIAVSTSGNSPALASKIRKQLEMKFGMEYAVYLDLMGRIRKDLLERKATSEENKRIFHELIEGGLLEAVRSGNCEQVKNELRRVLPSGMDIETLSSIFFHSSDST
jgi:precorrin-2 dehydrogenase / sirohydrochlorin ferrochelatase